MTDECSLEDVNKFDWSKLVAGGKTAGIDMGERAEGGFGSHPYAVYGASLAVVQLDCLTGEHVTERMDVVFDAGQMVNIGIELGQIEGGLVMSLGWLKSEHLTYDEHGVQQVRSTCILNFVKLSYLERYMAIQSAYAQGSAKNAQYHAHFERARIRRVRFELADELETGWRGRHVPRLLNGTRRAECG